jgi:hypothetical protein
VEVVSLVPVENNFHGTNQIPDYHHSGVVPGAFSVDYFVLVPAMILCRMVDLKTCYYHFDNCFHA